MYQYPYGNAQQLNLDWLMEQWQTVKQSIDGSLQGEIDRVEAAITDLLAARDAAAASAAAAGTSANAAAQSAQSAAANAATAAAQAAAANTARSNAAQAANNAQTYANTAQAQATAAANSAGAAATSASQAAASADDANDDAVAASGSATNAATSAAGALQNFQLADAARQAAQIAAQEAQDVLDSIPEDYSEMSDDVSDLKTSTTQNTDTISEMLTGFTQGENIASGTLISGYYSGSGNITVSNKYSHLDVNITGVTHLLIDGTMGTTSITAWSSLGCFWDDNDVRVTPNIPAQTALPYIVAVPTGAVKLGLNTDYKASDYPSSLPSALKIIPLTPSDNGVVKTKDLAAPTKNIKMLSGIIRNNGSGWGFINDSDHEPLNMSSVEVNGNGQIVVNYGFTAKKVLSLIATPDETFAQKYTIGGSVGKDKVTFNVFELAHTIGGAVSYNKSTDTWSITYSTFTNISFDSTTGKLTLTHETISGIGSAQRYLINADGRNCDVKVNSATDSTIELIFLDANGDVITTPSANMYMYVTRDINTRLVNANDISDANGNFWIMGIMLV